MNYGMMELVPWDLWPTWAKVGYYVWSYGGYIFLGYAILTERWFWAATGVAFTGLRWWTTGKLV
jgi:hypothetical protein